MATQQINGLDVEVSIIPADPQELANLLSARELWTVEAVDQTLRANAQFQASYPGAVLAKVESMRALSENAKGRYYLRYKTGSSATEFWGYIAPKPAFNFKRGLVGVVPNDKTPPA